MRKIVCPKCHGTDVSIDTPPQGEHRPWPEDERYSCEYPACPSKGMFWWGHKGQKEEETIVVTGTEAGRKKKGEYMGGMNKLGHILGAKDGETLIQTAERVMRLKGPSIRAEKLESVLHEARTVIKDAGAMIVSTKHITLSGLIDAVFRLHPMGHLVGASVGKKIDAIAAEIEREEGCPGCGMPYECQGGCPEDAKRRAKQTHNPDSTYEDALRSRPLCTRNSGTK